MAFNTRQRSHSLFVISEGQFYAKPSLKLERLEKDFSALKTKENEDQVELRRLRTENDLLHERIEKLEKAEAKLIHQNKESVTLVDKLVQDQAALAKKVEMSNVLRRELNIVKHQLLETERKLFDAENTIDGFCKNNKNLQRSISLDREEGHTILKHLQGELTTARLKEAEYIVTIRELNQKIADLEEAYMERVQQNSSKDKNRKTELKHLQEELLQLKTKDSRTVAEVNETKQKITELETQNQTCCNQIRRMSEDNTELQEKLGEAAKQEKILRANIKDLLRKLDDAEVRRQEEGILARIRDAENCQKIVELQQNIAEISIQNEELLTASKLNKSMDQELETSLQELHNEELLSDNAKLGQYVLLDSHTEGNTDEEIDAEINESKNLYYTFSNIIEGNKCCEQNFTEIAKAIENYENFPLASKITTSSSFYFTSQQHLETQSTAELEMRCDYDSREGDVEVSCGEISDFTSFSADDEAEKCMCSTAVDDFPETLANYPEDALSKILNDYPEGTLPEILNDYPEDALSKILNCYPEGILPKILNGYPEGTLPKILDNYPEDALSKIYVDDTKVSNDSLTIKSADNELCLNDAMIMFLESEDLVPKTSSSVVYTDFAEPLHHSSVVNTRFDAEEKMYKTNTSDPVEIVQEVWELYDEVVEVGSNKEVRVLSRNSTDQCYMKKINFINSCRYFTVNSFTYNSEYWSTIGNVKHFNMTSSSSTVFSKSCKKSGQKMTNKDDKPRNKTTIMPSEETTDYTEFGKIPTIFQSQPSNLNDCVVEGYEDNYLLDLVVKESTI